MPQLVPLIRYCGCACARCGIDVNPNLYWPHKPQLFSATFPDSVVAFPGCRATRLKDCTVSSNQRALYLSFVAY